MPRLALLIALASLTTACETAPPTIHYDFETFEAVNTEVADPIPLDRPATLKCYPSEEDCRIVGYTTEAEIDALERFKIQAEGNTEIAKANADGARFMMAREEAILAASKAQESITRLREEQLAFERSERRKEKWYYRALIGILIGAGAYASGN